MVLGSNGEAALLSAEERVELVKCVRTNITRNKLVIAGAGMEGTKQTIDLCKAMAAAGADAVLALTPSFFKGACARVRVVSGIGACRRLFLLSLLFGRPWRRCWGRDT